MFALTHRNRSICAVAGAVLSGAALALAPLYARSAFPSVSATALGATRHGLRAQSPDRREVLPEIQDPFARLSSDSARPALVGVPELPVLPANRGAVAGFPASATAVPIVRAIVNGEPSFALVDDGLSARIVGRGDPLSASRVRAIAGDAVTLEDGRRLTLPSGAP